MYVRDKITWQLIFISYKTYCSVSYYTLDSCIVSFLQADIATGQTNVKIRIYRCCTINKVKQLVKYLNDIHPFYSTYLFDIDRTKNRKFLNIFRFSIKQLLINQSFLLFYLGRLKRNSKQDCKIIKFPRIRCNE